MRQFVTLSMATVFLIPVLIAVPVQEEALSLDHVRSISINAELALSSELPLSIPFPIVGQFIYLKY
jgi:hypothetical protein